MKAATYSTYGPAEVLEIADVPQPAASEGEVLVEVHASSVTTADWRLRASAFPGATWLPGRLMTGLFRPRNTILGTEFAGRVVRTGPGAEGFAPGDAVFGFSGHGANAEYLTMPADGAIAPLPAGLSFAEAAALPFGAVAALVFLRDVAKLRPGQRVLVVGATGGVGVYAVQIARAMGADVTGMASAARRDLVGQLGASGFIDYRDPGALDAAGPFDVVFDAVGGLSFREARRVLRPDGQFVPLNFGLREAFAMLMNRWRNGPAIRIAVNGDSRADLDVISDMVATGTLQPVIDRSYALTDIVAAHRYVEGRHRAGAVVVTVKEEVKDAPRLAV